MALHYGLDAEYFQLIPVVRCILRLIFTKSHTETNLIQFARNFHSVKGKIFPAFYKSQNTEYKLKTCIIKKNASVLTEGLPKGKYVYMTTEGILVLIGLFISIVIGLYFKSKGTERLNQLSIPFQNLLQNSSYQDIYDDGRRTYLVEGLYKARVVRCEIDTTHINQHQAVLSMQPRLIPKIIPGLIKVFAPPIIFKNIRLIQDWVKADSMLSR